MRLAASRPRSRRSRSALRGRGCMCRTRRPRCARSCLPSQRERVGRRRSRPRSRREPECPSRTRRHVPDSTSQIRTVLSDEPERASRPSALQATLQTEPECPSRTRRHFPDSTSQIRTVLSYEPERARRAVGAPGHARDGAGVPFEDAEAGSGLDVPDPHGFVAEPERARWPSALQATLQTTAECPSRTRRHVPDSTSQIRTVLSCEPERARRAVGAPGHAIDVAGVPFEDAEARPDSTSQIRRFCHASPRERVDRRRSRPRY